MIPEKTKKKGIMQLEMHKNLPKNEEIPKILNKTKKKKNRINKNYEILNFIKIK